jgi:hypothetical protein
MIASLILSLALMATAEYLIHRYLQHKPSLPILQPTLHRHAVLHHRDGRNDLNVDLPAWYSAMLASPIVVVAWLVGFGGFGAIFLAVATAHAVIWTHLHRSFHGGQSYFMTYLPGWGFLFDHHIEHHDNPTKNFGAVFGPLVDVVAGTHAK